MFISHNLMNDVGLVQYFSILCDKIDSREYTQIKQFSEESPSNIMVFIKWVYN